MSASELEAQVTRFGQNESRVDKWVNGTEVESYIAADNIEVPSIRKFLKTMVETGLLKSQPFNTKALMEASSTTLVPVNSYAVVTDDPVLANNGFWQRTGASVWKYLAWNPVNMFKDWANSNPLFKPVQVKSGDNANNFTKPGIYYHWGAQIAEANLLNWPLYVGGNASFGVLIVRNPVEVVSLGLYQEFYSYHDAYKTPITRKYSQAGSFLPWAANVSLDDINKTKDIALSGTDILTLGYGTYSWASIALGNSFVNMPSVTYKFGRLEVKSGGNNGYKVIIFYPYGRDKNFYINSNYENNTWTGWRTIKSYEDLSAELSLIYATKSELLGALSGVLDNLTGTSNFGANYTQAQLDGNAIYGSAYYAGYNHITGAKGCSFNAIKARIHNPSGGNVEWRVYIGNKCIPGTYGYTVSAANALLPDFSGFTSEMPTTDKGAFEFKLNGVVSIPPNTPFVIIFRNVGLRTLRIADFYYTSNKPPEVESRGFSMWAQAQEWGAFAIANASPIIGYHQTGFQLVLSVAGASGGTTPTPEKYIPVLAFPPKIYALPGLQSHIYPEHLFLEDYNLYNHDITCSKGKQMERGWLWDYNSNTPDAPGNYPLTWNVHDKQTGDGLTSGALTLQIVNPSLKDNQTINISVIGDSLVNSGSITQGILNNAETDVTNALLIGTRGTGLNKHEGRGGWTINDYTGEGRTYYSFSVTGVTTTPAINSTKYKIGTTELLVQEVSISNGTGQIVCSLDSGPAPTLNSSGILEKSNSGIGDATISYSNSSAVSGNPFWNRTSNVLDYTNYLTLNSLDTPDIVFIQLGVNDTFGFTTDKQVTDFVAVAFPKLDTLINSIKASNSAVKIVLCAPPSYANQDAFGTNYACGQTSWRAKRNIVIFNRELYRVYSGKEANNIFVLASGVNVDTVNNFPILAQAIPVNSRNTAITYKPMVNGVHPDVSGYYQIADSMWACAKAI